MVTHKNLPNISWSEMFDVQEELKTSELIVETINAIFKSPTKHQTQLFFILPVPMPYANAETKLFSNINKEGIRLLKEVRIVTSHYKCYVIDTQQHFQSTLPHFFHLGVPELFLIVANCDFNFFVDEKTLTNFINEITKDSPHSKIHDFLSLHFDSGDLISCLGEKLIP